MAKEPIEARVGALLKARQLSLGAAESCTGGLIGHRVTNVPGSSDYFLGGLIAYANLAKVQMLGVRPETLERCGAVSEETVLEMATGVRRLLNADIGLSVSGIAGPGGGSAEKPIGLVWVGISAAEVELARRYQFGGDRLSIKEQAATAALQLVVDYLMGLRDGYS